MVLKCWQNLFVLASHSLLETFLFLSLAQEVHCYMYLHVRFSPSPIKVTEIWVDVTKSMWNYKTGIWSSRNGKYRYLDIAVNYLSLGILRSHFKNPLLQYISFLFVIIYILLVMCVTRVFPKLCQKALSFQFPLQSLLFSSLTLT